MGGINLELRGLEGAGGPSYNTGPTYTPVPNIAGNSEYRSAGSAGQQTVARADMLPTVRALVARALD